METMELLCTRKSVRSYTGKKVSDETLRKVLLAGQSAPTGMGRYDSLHFTVIDDPELLKDIDAAAGIMFGDPSRHPLYGAPQMILISFKAAGQEPGNTEYSNAAIAAHNISLAAVDAGVGQCLIWGAIFALNQKQDLVARLQLPEGFIPSCAVVLGETEETYELREIPEDRIAVSRL